MKRYLGPIGFVFLVLVGWVSTTGCALSGPGNNLGSASQNSTSQMDSDWILKKTKDGTEEFTTRSSNCSTLECDDVDRSNAFFQNVGGPDSNGRRCVSCHDPDFAFTITPKGLAKTFIDTDGGTIDDGTGLGAVFRLNDGANSPLADVSTTTARRDAYSMLLTKGLIRVELTIPAGAEFELIAVDDPHGYASVDNGRFSLFRRPLPTANLKFDSTVMWDGRELVPGVIVTLDTIRQFLENQSDHATTGHAQGGHLTQAQREEIVNFEIGNPATPGGLASAAIYDFSTFAGNLGEEGARGGPDAILAQPFRIGINDNFGEKLLVDGTLTLVPFSSKVFDIFDDWALSEDQNRRAVFEGQEIFNNHPIAITGVSGINDESAFGKPAVLIGTCTSCHDTPNGGNHSVPAPLNIGLVDEAHRTPDMPLYTLRNKTTGEIVKVTDPGRALIDGKWSHIGRFKGPMLRNLSVRGPFFHNGSAPTLLDAINFYNTRFDIRFTDEEKAKLLAFLRKL